MIPYLLPPKHRLMKFVSDVFDFLGVHKSTVNIYLVDGRTMRNLNRKFRGIDKATDVLAFPYPEDFPFPQSKLRPLGDIYLNPIYIARNKEALEYLLTHGLLHLLGFNHETKGDRIKMERLERELLEAISVQPRPLSGKQKSYKHVNK